MADGAGNNGRTENGRFAAGNPGGPGGARRRSCELRRAAEEAIAPEHIAAIMRKAARMALEGNLAAMRLVLERTCGRAAEAAADPEPVGITLPRLRTAADCTVATERLLDAVCQGTVDRDTARLLIDAIQTRIKAIEANDLEVRLAELEKAAAAIHPTRSRRF